MVAGRPSKALERRDHILDAMEVCVRENGIALAYLRQIADQSGLSLQMVSHYFGNRHSLVLAFVARIASRLSAEIDKAGRGQSPKERLHHTVRFLCDGRYKALAGNDVIGREIWGLAERDDDVRLIVWDAYENALDRLNTLVEDAYSHADEAACQSTAYAILFLSEANEFFTGISQGSVPPDMAEQLIFRLLAELEHAHPVPVQP